MNEPRGGGSILRQSLPNYIGTVGGGLTLAVLAKALILTQKGYSLALSHFGAGWTTAGIAGVILLLIWGTMRLTLKQGSMSVGYSSDEAVSAKFIDSKLYLVSGLAGTFEVQIYPSTPESHRIEESRLPAVLDAITIDLGEVSFPNHSEIRVNLSSATGQNVNSDTVREAVTLHQSGYFRLITVLPDDLPDTLAPREMRTLQFQYMVRLVTLVTVLARNLAKAVLGKRETLTLSLEFRGTAGRVMVGDKTKDIVAILSELKPPCHVDSIDFLKTVSTTDLDVGAITIARECILRVLHYFNRQDVLDQHITWVQRNFLRGREDKYFKLN